MLLVKRLIPLKQDELVHWEEAETDTYMPSTTVST